MSLRWLRFAWLNTLRNRRRSLVTVAEALTVDRPRRSSAETLPDGRTWPVKSRRAPASTVPASPPVAVRIRLSTCGLLA